MVESNNASFQILLVFLKIIFARSIEFKQSVIASCEVPLLISLAVLKSDNLKLSLFFSFNIVFIDSLSANFAALVTFKISKCRFPLVFVW